MPQTHSPVFTSVQPAHAISGTWRLGAGCALTLKPRTDGVLLAAQGGFWVTLSVPESTHVLASGDIFIATGERVTIPAGSTAVIEPWHRQPSLPSPSYFCWDAVAANLPIPVRQAGPWQLGVRQPLLDMRDGFAQVIHAWGALIQGLAGVIGVAASRVLLTQGMRKA